MRVALLALACGGCAATGPEAGPRLLRDVWSAPGDTGEGFHDVARAVNGVRGGGPLQGSLDVYSIGPELVLGVEGAPVEDGPGVDLVVFENPFRIRGGGTFVEPAVVEVTADGEAWAAFPHALVGDPGDADAWLGYAGLAPVALNVDDYPVDPLSEGAGGDRFDLADLDPGDPAAAEVLAYGFVAVRLTPATPSEPDVDGVWVR